MDAIGIEFQPVRPDMPSYDEPDKVAELVEGAMDAREGGERVLEMILPHLRDAYEDLNAAVESADLLLTHPLPFVGPMVAQLRKIPWVSSVLAPASFLSVYDPIVPPQWPWLYHLMRLSPWVGRGVMALATKKLDRLMKPVFELRAELGLMRGEQPVFGGQHSPTKVLALFSKLMAKPQPDWPRNTVVTGFPFYDRRDYFGETGTSPDLLKFLDEGPPPIVFTLGSSAVLVARGFFLDLISAGQGAGGGAPLFVGAPRKTALKCRGVGCGVLGAPA